MPNAPTSASAVKNGELEIERLEIDKIKPYSKNAKIHPREQIKFLKKLILENGYTVPIAVDKNNVVVMGHGRRLALLEIRDENPEFMDFAKVAVVRLSHLSEKQIAKARLADNSSAEMGKWDPDILGGELQDIFGDYTKAMVLEELQIDFSPPKLDMASDSEDEIPEVTRSVTMAGDLWELGPHHLLCGDSTSKEDMAKLMAGKVADVVVTDPPYAIYGSSSGVSTEVSDDKMVRSFFRDIFVAIGKNLKKFGHAYVCCDWRSWASLWAGVSEGGLTCKNMIVWNKKSPAMGAMYRAQHELLMFLVNFQRSKVSMSQEQTGQRSIRGGFSNVWDISRTPPKEKKHNAQKPVELIAQAIKNSTNEKEIALDLFCGSGTIFISAEKSDRIAYAMEIEPKNADTAVRRYIEYCKKNNRDPEVKRNGEPWKP